MKSGQLFPALQAACACGRSHLDGEQTLAHERYQQSLKTALWLEERDPTPMRKSVQRIAV